MTRELLVGGALLALVTGLCVWAYLTGTGLSGIRPQSAVVAVLAVSGPDGPALFAANCAGCHGAQAQGGVGPKLAGLVKPWTAPQFAHAVLNGQAPEGRALSAMMPRFETAGFDGLPPTDGQLQAVLKFVQAL
jgi:mono/diheme cytochrome c family protein